MPFNEDFCTVVKWFHHMRSLSEHCSSLKQQQRKNKQGRTVQISKKKEERKQFNSCFNDSFSLYSNDDFSLRLIGNFVCPIGNFVCLNWWLSIIVCLISNFVCPIDDFVCPISVFIMSLDEDFLILMFSTSLIPSWLTQFLLRRDHIWWVKLPH